MSKVRPPITRMMKENAWIFVEFSEDTRQDFHEPDEQGIRLKAIVGTKLDNAFGTHVDPVMLSGGFQEAVVFFERGVKKYTFNLADLCALAKIGAEEIVKGI